MEAHDAVVKRLLFELIRDERIDILWHLEWRLGKTAAKEWVVQLG